MPPLCAFPPPTLGHYHGCGAPVPQSELDEEILTWLESDHPEHAELDSLVDDSPIHS